MDTVFSSDEEDFHELSDLDVSVYSSRKRAPSLEIIDTNLNLYSYRETASFNLPKKLCSPCKTIATLNGKFTASKSTVTSSNRTFPILSKSNLSDLCNEKSCGWSIEEVSVFACFTSK